MGLRNFKTKSIFGLAFVVVVSAVGVNAQAIRKKKVAKKNPVAATVVKMPTPEVETMPTKRNERPIADVAETTIVPSKTKSVYFYEFSAPNFVVRKILIEHDKTGKGTISFEKRDYDGMETDPIELSSITMDKINEALAALDFLNSTENYQYEKDYSHLGTSTIRVVGDKRERTVVYNWTQNKDAKNLADEYRRISNQYLWQFDIDVARKNQPLEAPKLVDTLDSLLRRKEISDPVQMSKFLEILSNDERIPLIARNHAGKLVKQIQKENSKH